MSLQAPNLSNLIGTRVDGSTFWLAFEATDGRKYELQFHPEALAAATVATLQGLARLRPTDQTIPYPQPQLALKGVGLVMLPEGQVGLEIRFEPAGAMILPLDADKISSIQLILAQAGEIAKPLRH